MERKDGTTDRRHYLKYAGSVVIAGLAGCSGSEDGEDGGENDGDTGSGDLEPNHPEDHSDGELSEAEKTGTDLNGATRQPENLQEKDAATVSYVHKPSGEKACANCSLYVPDQNDDGYGACTAVKGTIHPCDFCVLYTEFEGDTPATCEQI